MFVAEIIYSDVNSKGSVVFRFKADNNDSIYELLMKITNGNHGLSSDAVSWCELASVGEEYDVEYFNIEIIELDTDDEDDLY